MSAYATQRSARESEPSHEINAPGADEKKSAADFGIGFDGRYYRYRDYRYDRLSDAINFAKLEKSRSEERPPSAPPQWLEPLRPTEAEQQLMAEFGITFDGKCFIYESYRYDHCVDAANYAKLVSARRTGG